MTHSVSPANVPPAMIYRNRKGLGILIASVFFSAFAAGDDSALSPQAGLLLLQNGQVISGSITHAGDFYVVIQQRGGELRLPAADVETRCVDLEDAYNYKAATVTGKKAQPFLDLAAWCMRHGMSDKAAGNLLAAARLEPENRELELLERRLEYSRQSPRSEKQPLPLAATEASSAEIESRLRELPKGAVERFAAIVHPILLNRCAMNGCHGPESTSSFRLLRPAKGLQASTRFTQRNLFATLAFIDREHPAESKLLKLPSQRHGGAAPLFEKRNQVHCDELAYWANQLYPQAAASIVQRIPTTGGEPGRLAQATILPQATAEASAATPMEKRPAKRGKAAQREGRQEICAAAHATVAAMPANESRVGFPSGDPFDPAIFNERFHSPSSESERGTPPASRLPR